MNRPILIVAIAMLAGGACMSQRAGAAGSAPALFTSAQATAGAKEYATHCSACHGTKMEGVSAPALRGDGSGLQGDSVSEAWTFISSQMPAGAPASLKTNEYLEIVSYILKQNGHPAGSNALTETSAKTIKTKV